MSTSKTDGRTYFGTIVEIEDDPQKMGRVRVLIPQIHGKTFKSDDMPWIQLSSVPNQEGQFSFDRPPQVGATVMVTFPHGEVSSGFGIVTDVLNQVPDFTKQISGTTKNLTDEGWYQQAITTRYGTYGQPDREQTTESNDTGKPKVTGKHTDAREAPSMQDKVALPSNVVTALLQPYNNITQVATAVQSDLESMSAEIAALLDNQNLSLSNLLNLLQDSGNATVASLQQLVGKNTPLSGANFLHTTVAQYGGSGQAIVDAFSEVEQSGREVLDFMRDTINGANTDILELSTEIKKITANTAFGEVTLEITKNGDVNVNISESVQGAINNFLSIFDNIENATGNILDNSQIPTYIKDRLSTEGVSAFKGMMQELQSLSAKIIETK